MHVVVEEELMRVRNNTYMSGGSSSSSSSGGNGSQQEWEAAWKRMLRMCFLRMDRMSSYTCDCGSLGYPCGCPPAYTLRLTGSTAVVAILTQESIIVANCGDSRAVLSRAGRAVPLSCDHKPDKLSERARIEAYGGKVIFAGVPRVGGVLAVSRALGDNCLKPYVIPEPEISFIEREAEDECLILASDGMWDVISNEMACQVARQCLREENPVRDHSSRPLVEGDDRGAIFSSRSASAAAVLTNLALTRLSRDNISVIVVDLKRNHAGR
ncbi:hypothetical protein K7X08_035123 [Anisodus acutangulus]|uniref:PPM-type phosphatase domain-containing protein n=1 Tax=Anisodus acutangulus TaxID=402998 RepID=A0A9Q1LGM0_9SOLA|nr:hypothetical protein K7X08_035123 [Anisodus acutangulus]